MFQGFTRFIFSSLVLFSAISQDGLSAQQQTEDQIICCVDFYGQPAGLKTRQQCQFDGGDAAPKNRCEAPKEPSEEDLLWPAPEGTIPVPNRAGGDAATSWYVPALNARRYHWDTQKDENWAIKSISTIYITNPHRRRAVNISWVCDKVFRMKTGVDDERYYSVREIEPLRRINIPAMVRGGDPLADKFADELDCIVMADSPIYVYVEDIQMVSRRVPGSVTWADESEFIEMKTQTRFAFRRSDN